MKTRQMQGKVVLITGGTSGIGKETAKGLADMGASITLVGRNQVRGEAAVAELRQSTGNPHIDLITADLSAQAAVRQLAQDFLATHDRLDVLLNNIGGLYRTRWETVDGIEASLAMNHLNPFLLTQWLLPMLKASAPARIVNVTTSGHYFAKLDFANLQAEKWYRGLDIYTDAKLANLMTLYKLADQLEGSGVTINAADPGGALTDMTSAMTPEMVPWVVRLFWPFFRIFQRSLSLEKAAHSSIYAAAAPELAGVSGKYLNPSGKITKSAKRSYDQVTTQQIWERTLELTHLADKPSSIPLTQPKPALVTA